MSNSELDASVVLPLVVFAVPVLYFGWRHYKRLFSKPANDPAVTGIGRGAPGFLTSVSKVQVPAHLVARIRAGEEVSAEEVTAAIEAEKQRLASGETSAETPKRKVKDGVDEDWLPKEQNTGSNSKGRRRKR